MIVKIENLATGLVLNRHGNVKVKPAKGNALSLFTDLGTNDQRFEMKYKGKYVYFVLQSNPTLVINRHSKTGDLMLWPLASSTEADILFDTQTEEDKVRLLMPHHGVYMTAPNLFVGGNIETEKNPEKHGSQFFKIVDVAAKGGTTAGEKEPTAPTGKVLNVPAIMQMNYKNGGTYCLAATLLGLSQFYGHKIDMETLINKGCVRRSDGYVYTPSPFVSWTRTGYKLSEKDYCAAITAQINQGAPVVMEIWSAKAGYHYITCVSGGATPDAIKVNDPMLGRTTLRDSFKRRGQAYQHLRTTKKL